MLTDCRRRISVYSKWDLRLRPYTRFFGAAAVTNATLAELFGSCVARSLLSVRTTSFLSELGMALEHLNLDLAKRLACQPLPLPDLDGYIVHAEQSAVEFMLHKLQCSNTLAHEHVIREINRLLERVRTGLAFGLLFPYGSYYSRALRTAHRELGRPTDFATQSDRELIGRILIGQLREG
jgi:hypothetical protein